MVDADAAGVEKKLHARRAPAPMRWGPAGRGSLEDQFGGSLGSGGNNSI